MNAHTPGPWVMCELQPGFNVVRPSQHGEEPRVLQQFDTAEEAQEWIDALDPWDAAYLPYVEVA